MSAFTRMFYEPNAVPPRLSMARVLGWPCSILGLVVVAHALLFSQAGDDAVMKRAAIGLGLVVAGVVLYTLVEWRRVKAGPVEIERG